MRRFLLLVALTALAACQAPTGHKTVHQPLTLDGGDGSSSWGFSPLTDLTKARSVTFTRPAGHVSYVLTNTSTVATATAKLSGVSSVAESRAVTARTAASVPTNARRIISLADRPSAPDRPRQSSARSAAPPPSFDNVNDTNSTYAEGTSTHDFIDALWTSSPQAANVHPSHLRKRATATTSDSAVHVLNIWVADDCWSTDGTNLVASEPGTAIGTSPTTAWVPPTNKVTQAMVDALATKFLNNGVSDIYGWDTGVFGAEWPSTGPTTYKYFGHSYTMIDGSGNIHIFICNLNPPPSTASDGVLLGYFHALNNFLASDQEGSNEKILFALDADSLANPDDDGSSTTNDPGTWSITDYWPAQALSTLAHEFQHMIHFYQKQVRQNISAETSTWINEMCSMLAEDLLSDKLGTPGPRGILGTNYTTGTSPNPDGRLPDFDYWHDVVPLTGWNSPNNKGGVLANYASAYAFGAWLIRNYGGPALLRDIVQNPYTDYQAVVNAVNEQPNGGAATFTSLVRDWGLATVLNSSTQAGLAYSKTASPWSFDWTDGDETYSAGSIDLSKYRYAWDASAGVAAGHRDGLYTDPASFSSGDVVAAGATSIHSGTFSGPATVTLTLPPYVVLTVVAQ